MFAPIVPLLRLPKPYLIFVGDQALPTLAKTGFGVRDWARQDCVAQWRLVDEAVDLSLPDLRPKEAYSLGARSLLIGIAPVGGTLPDAWVKHMIEALEAGLDLVSGLHMKLADVPAIAEVAAKLGRSIHDVRHCSISIPAATGAKRTGKRLMMVGTDCALGKKYTALALTKAMKARGLDADFRATGQTGIMIAGSGIAIDAVVSDFIAGAAEILSPNAAPDHWDVIEGQGALFHPAYAGVTLGLLHGSQPDALILCHQPGRIETAHFPGFPLPSLSEAIQAYLPLARRTNPEARFVGISLNTGHLSEADALEAAAAATKETQLPAFDPMRFGIDNVLDRMLT